MPIPKHACPDCRCVSDSLEPNAGAHAYFCAEPTTLPVPRACPDRNAHIGANWDAFLLTLPDVRDEPPSPD